MTRRFAFLLLIVAARLSTAQSVSSRIDSLFSPFADPKSPGMAVLVRSQGRTLFQRGYGIRDLRTSAKIDEQTDFRLASFTKQFTAMATMLLIHDGKLQYDSKLTGIFPDFPAYGRAITVRHLLTHTGGLPDYEDLMDAAEKAHSATWSPTHQIQDREVMDLLKQQTAGKFAPGTAWSYSNSGYVVLGLIIAKISGEPLGQFLAARIFTPLHMTGTLAYVNGENTVPNRAYGHTRRPAGFVETDQSSTSATLGDGGIYSNLADLAKWDESLQNHALLISEEMRPALTPVKLANGAQPVWPVAPGGDNLYPGNPVSYGFGWFLDPYKSRARMWHFGSTTGFSTVIDRFTSDRLTIIILCNRTDVDPATFALQVADVVSVGRAILPAAGFSRLLKPRRHFFAGVISVTGTLATNSSRWQPCAFSASSALHHRKAQVLLPPHSLSWLFFVDFLRASLR